MLSNNKQSISCLEDLPNELFYILFSYFDINELYKSIFQLNLRFMNLINSLSCYHLCLKSEINPDIIKIFASKIKSIHINTKSIIICLSSFYNSLSVLILEELTQYYLDQLPLLIHLEYLEIKTSYGDVLSNQLIQYLTSSTHLRHLGLPYWCLNTRDHIFSSLYSLRLFRGIHENEFVSLLHCIPNLIYFYLYDPYVRLSPTIDDILRDNYYNLTYFRLNLTNGFTHSQVDFYLAHISHIKLFHFSSSPCLVYNNQIGPYAILNSIANIIQKRLLNLERFICFIIFEIKSNDSFDITKVHSIYNQNYSIQIGKNTQTFKSNWKKN
jgi:hypothetical protein